jgi:hypothetical protein
LDEALVKWAVESPIWEKCGFQSNVLVEREIPNLEPGKKVLRLLAYELGMHSVAQEKKRAVRLPFSLGMISLTANRFNLGQGRRRWNWVIQKAQR